MNISKKKPDNHITKAVYEVLRDEDPDAISWHILYDFQIKSRHSILIEG
jgi:hypothetical protein